MLVTIKNKEYNFSVDSVWGPLYTYEELFGDKIPFNASRILCIHLMLYCILLRCNKDFDLKLDNFLDALNDMQLEKTLRCHYMQRVEILTAGVSDSGTCSESDKKKG